MQTIKIKKSSMRSRSNPTKMKGKMMQKKMKRRKE